jgi:hypothetical protein
MSFCARLGERGKAAVRLPTEASGIRVPGGKYDRYYWGVISTRNIAGMRQTQIANDFAPARSREAQRMGPVRYVRKRRRMVHGLYGEAYYAKSPKKNPTGPESGKARVVRGGNSSILSAFPVGNASE